MVQHLLLIGVAAPLLVLRRTRCAWRSAALPTGRREGWPRLARFSAVARADCIPLSRGFNSPPCSTSRTSRRSTRPRSRTIPMHACEHALYLASALIFWTPLLAVAPAPHAPRIRSACSRFSSRFPMSAFLGFIFYVANHALYAHYAGARCGADQMNAGAVMWLAGGGAAARGPALDRRRLGRARTALMRSLTAPPRDGAAPRCSAWRAAAGCAAEPTPPVAGRRARPVARVSTSAARRVTAPICAAARTRRRFAASARPTSTSW